MPLAGDAIAIAWAGIRAVNPSRAVARTLHRRGQSVRVGGSSLAPGPGGEVRLLAVGKAAGAMADAASDVVGRDSGGLAVVPWGYPPPRRGVPVVWGDHPIPRARSFAAGRRVRDYLARLGEQDAVLFLLSGGGSASLELPLPGLSPSDLTRTGEGLLGSGAAIGEVNSVRRHLSAVKGGRLATLVASRRFATLAISDVVGDRPPDIASGPTVGDPTTFRDALRVVRRHSPGVAPVRARRFLREGVLGVRPETPKPTDPLFRGRSYVLAASNRTALEAAAEEAGRRGYATHLRRQPIVGTTAAAAVRFARALLATGGRSARSALLGGGETTVELGRRPGRGGRNQEFALAAAALVRGRRAVVLSAGTDGVDGPTDAGGGWVDGETIDRARSRRVDLAGALRYHASYDALERLGALWKPGPTGTNVMDLHIGLVEHAPRNRTSPDTEGSSRRRAAPSSRRRRS